MSWTIPRFWFSKQMVGKSYPKYSPNGDLMVIYSWFTTVLLSKWADSTLLRELLFILPLLQNLKKHPGGVKTRDLKPPTVANDDLSSLFNRLTAGLPHVPHHFPLFGPQTSQQLLAESASWWHGDPHNTRNSSNAPQVLGLEVSSAKYLNTTRNLTW